MPVQWKLLSEKRPSYNVQRIEEMRLLYAGGYDVQDHAGLFLAQLNQESPQAFSERKRMSAYRPYLGKFINIYSANLHSVEIYVRPDVGASDSGTTGDVPLDNEFYKLFAGNCDRRGTDFNQFMKCHATKRALIEERAFIRADFPKPEARPTNLLEEEVSGVDRAYLTEIDSLSVWNYKIDPVTGLFEWMVLGNQICVKKRFNDTAMYHYLVEVLQMAPSSENEAELVCVSEFYRTEPNADKSFVPFDLTDIPLVETIETSFREIPIFITDLSGSMSLGFKLGPLAVEHYNMQSYETSATAKACVTIPVLKLGPNVPAPGGPINLAQIKTKRGDDPKGQFNKKGYLTLGSEDELTIVEAQGTALKFIHLQNEDRVEGMHEMANQLHSSSKQTSSKTGRSAQAMRESRFQMEISLVDYRTEIYRVTKNIYRAIATARGESIVWVPGGLCVEPPEDREILLKEAVALSAYKIGSARFDKKYRFRLANSLIGNQSREEQEDIMLEINASVDRENAADLYGPKFDPTLQQEINAQLKIDEPGVYPADSTVAQITANKAKASRFGTSWRHRTNRTGRRGTPSKRSARGCTSYL